MEIVGELAEMAKRNLANYPNVKVIIGNGAKGFEEEAPFDRIIVTCSARRVPEDLKEQLTEGGKMIIPVGEVFYSKLLLLEKKHGETIEKDLNCACSFVPLIE